MPLVSANQEAPRVLKKLLGEGETSLSDKQWAELPLDDLLVQVDLVPVVNVENSKYCVLCEYVSHIVQETIDQPMNEDNIIKTVSEICDKLPKSVQPKCREYSFNHALMNFIDLFFKIFFRRFRESLWRFFDFFVISAT